MASLKLSLTSWQGSQVSKSQGAPSALRVRRRQQSHCGNFSTALVTEAAHSALLSVGVRAAEIQRIGSQDPAGIFPQGVCLNALKREDRQNL
jgi:hypothetical protein